MLDKIISSFEITGFSETFQLDAARLVKTAQYSIRGHGIGKEELEKVLHAALRIIMTVGMVLSVFAFVAAPLTSYGVSSAIFKMAFSTLTFIATHDIFVFSRNMTEGAPLTIKEFWSKLRANPLTWETVFPYFYSQFIPVQQE